MPEIGEVPNKAKPDDLTILAQVADERRQSIGFDNDAVLLRARQRSLEYYKGEMIDVPALDGRSRAISTDVADAIETILPDLVEIFTSEEVAAFQPKGEEDEEAAEQETDYINHVFFNENSGFLILYSIIKDALQVKTGVTQVSVEDFEEEEDFQGKEQEEAAAAANQYGDDLESAKFDAATGLWSYTIKRKGKKPKVVSVAPEDFTVSRDTVELKNTPYCAMRARKRVYELIAMGLSRAKVEQLPSYGYVADSDEQRARDTAGEGDSATAGTGDRRVVEVVQHYVRQANGRYIRVLTGQDEGVLLEREEVSRHGFSAITPYIVPHRFYGESISDKLMEIQRIRTALTRMALDAGYFALNGRSYIDMNQVNEWTISDLLNNAPNMPIRGNGPAAVTPLASSGLSFDAFGALEYFSTQAEQRTGIVRNAQGLNPNTLHDTASGAIALMSAAQKRVRLIARILAETGIKDMMLTLHAVIRETASGPLKARLRNKWVDLDPTSWGVRSDMTIEIGMGASGKEAQALMLQEGLGVMERIAAGQGGPVGPVVTWDNIYQMAERYFVRGLGFKTSDGFLTDPKTAPPQEPQPDPAMLEMQAKQQQAEAELALKQQDAQARLAMESERDAAKAQREQESAMLDAQLKREEAGANLTLKREQLAAELALKREQLQAELELKREQLIAENQLKALGLATDAEVSVATSEVEPGGAAG